VLLVDYSTVLYTVFNAGCYSKGERVAVCPTEAAEGHAF
jgi:hypothetical protein